MPVSLEDLKLFREVALAAYDLAMLQLRVLGENSPIYERDAKKAEEAIDRLNTLLED